MFSLYATSTICNVLSHTLQKPTIEQVDTSMLELVKYTGLQSLDYYYCSIIYLSKRLKAAYVQTLDWECILGVLTHIIGKTLNDNILYNDDMAAMLSLSLEQFNCMESNTLVHLGWVVLPTAQKLQVEYETYILWILRQITMTPHKRKHSDLLQWHEII